MMDWFAKYVGVAKEFGIIEGYPGGFFKPYGKVTFSEASKMIVLGLYGDDDLVAGSPWYKPYVDVLGDANAIPTTIGFFNQEITRGEMAEMIYRLKEGITNKPFTNYNEIAEGVQTGYATNEDETEEIIQKISEYCEEHDIPECLPVISYSVVDLDEKYSVVETGGFNYLLTKKDNEWGVSIVSQENNICDTGSGSSDLFEYCNR